MSMHASHQAWDRSGSFSFSTRMRWILLALAIATALPIADAKTFLDIPANTESCFVERLVVGDPLRGSYQVVEGGFLDIDVRVFEPGTNNPESFGEVAWSADRSSQGKFDLVASKNGFYHICFGNKMSTLSTKSIAFAIHTGHGDLVDEDVSEEDIATNKDLQPVENKIRRLSDKIAELREQEEYLIRSFEISRSVAQSNQQRVLMSTVFEGFVLVAVNLWQLFYLRRFFEVRRRI